MTSVANAIQSLVQVPVFVSVSRQLYGYSHMMLKNVTRIYVEKKLYWIDGIGTVISFKV